jgi:hypothetical protein
MSAICSNRFLMSLIGLASVGDRGRGGIRASWSICCCCVSAQCGSLRSREPLVVFPVVILGTVGQFGLSSVVEVGLVYGVAASSATLKAHSTVRWSGEDCVRVCREPCRVKVGDTASSSIWVAHSTLCSIERDEVNWIIDRSSGPSPTKPHR